jgi:hypothetical protein
VEGVLLDIEPRQKIGIYVPAQPPAGKIFNIYPNPSSSLFYVESDFFEDDEPVSLAVFDVQGQLVFQTEIRAVGKKIIVDVGKLKDGVYQCTITNEQQIRSFTFIKSN